MRNAGTNPASLAFRTTQQGEVILEAGGAEIYRWGRDKMFAAALEERALNPGQTWTFTLEDTLRIEPGPYRLTALIPARPVVPPFSTSIVVEPE